MQAGAGGYMETGSGGFGAGTFETGSSIPPENEARE